MKHVFPLLLIVLLFGCNGPRTGGSRNQVWMPRNLDVTTYRNGDPIPEVTDPEQWKNLTTGAWCYYNNDHANNATYGKLYNWYAVNDPRGLAPVGYHIPTLAEWQSLGGANDGGNLKETGTAHWLAPNTGATNSAAFTGLPGGQRVLLNGVSFVDINRYGYWWTITSDAGSPSASFRQLAFDNNYAIGATVLKNTGLSVRCVQD